MAHSEREFLWTDKSREIDNDDDVSWFGSDLGDRPLIDSQCKSWLVFGTSWMKLYWGKVGGVVKCATDICTAWPHLCTTSVHFFFIFLLPLSPWHAGVFFKLYLLICYILTLIKSCTSSWSLHLNNITGN